MCVSETRDRNVVSPALRHNDEKELLLYLRLKAAHALQPVCYLAVTAMVSSRVL